MDIRRRSTIVRMAVSTAVVVVFVFAGVTVVMGHFVGGGGDDE